MKNLYLLALLLFSLFLPSITNGQLLPWFTQYREYQGLINPASLNNDYLVNHFYNFSAGVSYRQEGFAPFDEVPVTQSLRVEWIAGGNYNQKFRLLLGGYVINDQFGATGFTGSFVRLAGFAASDPRFGAVSLGLSFGLVQFRIKSEDLYFHEEKSELQEYYDPKQIYPSFGFGLYYRKQFGSRNNTGDFYAGVSVPQIRNVDLDTPKDTIANQFGLSGNTGFYAVAGFYIPYSDNGYWEPSVWFKKLTQFGTWHVNFNLRHQYKQIFWVGGGFGAGGENQRSAHLEFGVLTGNLKGGSYRYQSSVKPYLKIGIGVDYYFSGLTTPLDPAIELNLALLLPQR